MRTVIPALRDLLYEHCGYIVPAKFTPDFVSLHGDNWRVADRDWTDIVGLVLNTTAVSPGASGAQAIRQAVEAAAVFLTDDEIWPWCPICFLGTSATRKDETDGR
ncbi:hypothetical protein [Winogradskya humida]|uniref:Uncharacterized protein n=1 Tax=Winogradskya humida TaxID=113566 RepID=A0ABQ3ZTA9_9ACTN|nr:hypothetical protein [Actinoplanes humidus]GIE21806.1 hypothetical protein Ahu01nite_049080 [Actinoplanes humidus]